MWFESFRLREVFSFIGFLSSLQNLNHFLSKIAHNYYRSRYRFTPLEPSFSVVHFVNKHKDRLWIVLFYFNFTTLKTFISNHEGRSSFQRSSRLLSTLHCVEPCSWEDYSHQGKLHHSQVTLHPYWCQLYQVWICRSDSQRYRRLSSCSSVLQGFGCHLGWSIQQNNKNENRKRIPYEYKVNDLVTVAVDFSYKPLNWQIAGFFSLSQ